MQRVLCQQILIKQQATAAFCQMQVRPALVHEMSKDNTSICACAFTNKNKETYRLLTQMDFCLGPYLLAQVKRIHQVTRLVFGRKMVTSHREKDVFS
jgi:hypothetical protein